MSSSLPTSQTDSGRTGRARDELPELPEINRRDDWSSFFVLEQYQGCPGMQMSSLSSRAFQPPVLRSSASRPNRVLNASETDDNGMRSDADWLAVPPCPPCPYEYLGSRGLPRVVGLRWETGWGWAAIVGGYVGYLCTPMQPPVALNGMTGQSVSSIPK